jgi:hypothetical protein
MNGFIHQQFILITAKNAEKRRGAQRVDTKQKSKPRETGSRRKFDFYYRQFFSFPPFALMQNLEPRLRFARLPDGQASDGQAKNQGRPDRSAQPSVPPHNGQSSPGA